MITIDVALTGVVIGMLATVAGGITAFIKVFRKYDSLPDRVSKLEEETKDCPFYNQDTAKIQEAIEDLTKRSENDFRMIMQINRAQTIMMDGLCALLDHQATGNHVEKMEEVKTEMMKEMLRSREEVLRYE